MLSRLFIAALWPPAQKGLTSWLSFVMFNSVFITFPIGILGQVWYLIVSIPDFFFTVLLVLFIIIDSLYLTRVLIASIISPVSHFGCC